MKALLKLQTTGLALLLVGGLLSGCGLDESSSEGSTSSSSSGTEKAVFSLPAPVKLKGGEAQFVTWPYQSAQPPILSAMLSSDGGLTWTLQEPYLANLGSYAFIPPLVDGANYVLKFVSDTQTVAITDPFEIDSTAPALNTAVFSSATDISVTEFQTYATYLAGVPNNIWTLDFTNATTTFVNDANDYSAFIRVSASQRGGAISCSDKICTYTVPATAFNNDYFTVYFRDSVGNESSAITVNLNPLFVPSTGGGGAGGGGGGAGGGGGGGAGSGPPTLIPIGTINDGGLGTSDPFTYCPKNAIENFGQTVVRICRAGDAWAGCTAGAALTTTYLNSLADGTRVEVVYDTGASSSANSRTLCDVQVNRNNITIVGVCGRPQISGLSCGNLQKANFVTNGSDSRFVNLEFTAEFSAANNGAGIRHQGHNIVVSHSYFHDSQQGILSAGSGTFLIQKSKFQNLGSDGYSHTAYIGKEADHLVVKDSIFARSYLGHEIKSRAQQTTIQCSVFTSRRSTAAGSADAQDNNLADFPNGGKVLIEDSVFVKANSSSHTLGGYYGILGFAEEAAVGSANLNYYQDMTFRNNLVLNYYSNPGWFMYKQFDANTGFNEATSFNVTGNEFSGLGTTYSASKFFYNRLGTDLSFDLSGTNTLTANPDITFPTRDALENVPIPSACPDLSNVITHFPN